MHLSSLSYRATGYGDIHATNTIERIYAIFMMLSGSLMFGALIARLRAIFDNDGVLRKDKDQSNAAFGYLLEKKLVPLKLRLASMEAYSYYVGRRPTIAETGLFDRVPETMRANLVSHQFKSEIDAIKIRNILSRPFLVDLITVARPYSCESGAVIYNRGDVATEFSFLLIGKVTYWISGVHGEHVVGMSTNGDFFGDFEFYKRGGTRLIAYHAQETSSLLSVSYQDMERLIGQHPADGRRFLLEMQRRYNSLVHIRQTDKRLTLSVERRPKEGSTGSSKEEGSTGSSKEGIGGSGPRVECQLLVDGAARTVMQVCPFSALSLPDLAPV